MSSGTTATWFDALPPLSEYNLPPSNNASCTSWSSQIVSAREAVRAGRKGSHYALAQTLLDAYKSGMGSECLSESLVILRGLHECASSAERKQTTMIDLGEALFAEHKRTGTLEPVQEMVRIYEQASSEDTLGLDMRCQLAQALIARGAFTGEDADLCRAKAMLDAIHLESDEWDASNPRFVVVSAMHHAVMWKAHRQHSLPDLRRLGEDLVRHLKGPYPLSWRADLLAACFSVCTVICRLSDNVACTSDAVKMAEDTLKTLSQETFAVLSALTEFCLILEARHKGKAGYVLTLRQLVERMFQAAKGNRVNTGEAHHALGSWMLRSELWSAHDRANSADVAAAQYRQALAICPANHVHVHVYLVGLCLSLIYRNRWTGSRSALNEAVALYDSHADIARRVPPFAINLTGVMMRRAQTGRLRLVSKWTLTRRAVQVLQDALLATPSSNSYFPDLLEQLSLVYSLESSWGGSVDETEALAIMRRALTTRIEQGRIETSREEWVLAKFLVSLAQRKGDTGAVNEAMQLLDNISQPPTDENNNDVGLDWLRANCYMVRYKLLGAPEDLRIAQDMFLAACDETRGTLWRTLRHVFSWADTARYAGQEATEMRAYQRIISMLPRLAYLGEDIATRVEALQLAEGLSCRAATLALTLNNVCGAIEVLEQSRGVVWSQSLQPKTAVESIPPQYVEAFTGTARSLEKATNPAERRRLAAQLEALSRQIRRVVGYERFCLPRLYPDLKAGASLGFVVLVIPSDAFTDVVIIRDTEMAPVHLRLPSLKLPRLQKLGATLKKMSDRSRDSATDRPRGMKKVEAGQAQLSSDVEAAYMNALGQLWTELVYPVLTELRLQVRPYGLIRRFLC
jgi:tetratricopeptide (TPR) repeat protein